MTRIALTIVALAAAAGSIAFAAQDHRKGDVTGVEFHTPDQIQWTAGPGTFRKGAMMAVLEGDPAKDGPFVMRLKFPDGFRVSPHTHPGIERVTVLQGTLNVGIGDTFDERATKVLPTGSFFRLPAGTHHYGWSKGETIIQLNGVGPWGINYLNQADDPRSTPAQVK